jgi:predicted transcriptional regulator
VITTIELPTALHERARIVAIKRRSTLRALIEQGLRELLRREER